MKRVEPRVLITGGTGQIGRRLARVLLADGMRVRVADMVEGDDRDVEYRVGNITDPAFVDSAVAGADYVVHLAAIPVEINDPRKTFDINLYGTFNILEACAENAVKGVLFASSVTAYALLRPSQPFVPPYFPIDEHVDTIPDRNYAAMKLMGEMFMRSYSRGRQLNGLALRIATVVNPEAPDWPGVIDRIGDPEAPFIADRTFRDFMWQYVHVDDAVHAFERGIAHLRSNPQPGFESFNIGAADCLSTRPTLELIGRFFPDVPLLKDPGRLLDEPYRALYGIDRARSVLGYSPTRSWRDYRGGERA